MLCAVYLRGQFAFMFGLYVPLVRSHVPLARFKFKRYMEEKSNGLLTEMVEKEHGCNRIRGHVPLKFSNVCNKNYLRVAILAQDLNRKTVL